MSRLLSILLLLGGQLIAQGPPLLTEKMIMLGQGNGTSRVLYIYSNADRFNARYIMPTIDYNLTNKISLELGLPFQQYIGSSKNFKLSDIMISGKYQNLKVDFHGKTIRISSKIGHSFYVAKQHGHIRPSGTMIWGSYGGVIVGMESLKLGVIGDFGFIYVRDIFPQQNETFFQGKLSFGFPMLKPIFPIRQLNLYLESELTKQINATSSVFYLAPGIQYVFGELAFEFFYQRQILQYGNNNYYPNETFGGGLRFIY
ncbi:MAG TPA: hypothetical protein PKA44_06195 [Saprospiraceae bacterium]|nr:hypothetical protein [Saprospiraceae bacterium]